MCIKSRGSKSEVLGGVGFLTTRIFLSHRSRIFLSDSKCPIGSFLHHTPKLGIPVEMVQFLLKPLLKQRFFAVHHGCHWFWQPNFIPFMLRSLESEISERSERSDILPPTPQPWSKVLQAALLIFLDSAFYFLMCGDSWLPRIFNQNPVFIKSFSTRTSTHCCIEKENRFHRYHGHSGLKKH